MPTDPHELAESISRLSKASLAGALTFPEVLAGLSAAGVGSYFADYRRAQTSYYTRSDQAHVHELASPTGPTPA
jgi:uncharacterized protein YbcV (DUF1398 family)